MSFSFMLYFFIQPQLLETPSLFFIGEILH